MEEKIKKILRAKNFSFMQLLKMQELAEELAQELYGELSIDEKVQLVWQVKVKTEGDYLGSLFEKMTVKKLTQLFIEGLKELADNAVVSFNDKTANKIEPSEDITVVEEIEEEPPIIPTSTKEEQQDGTSLPKGVKRV